MRHSAKNVRVGAKNVQLGAQNVQQGVKNVGYDAKNVQPCDSYAREGRPCDREKGRYDI